MFTRLIEPFVFDYLGPRRVHHVRPVLASEATGLVREVYDQMRRDFQIVPPVSIHSPIPELLAGAWCVLRECQLAGPADRLVREAVVSAISQSNRCPFCVDVHTTMLRGGRAGSAAMELLNGDRIDDPRVQTAVLWGRATRRPGAEILRSPPFEANDLSQIRGTAIAFHYINRMVNVFLFESPFPVAPGMGAIRGVFRRLAGSTFARRMMRRTVEPGESLALLPDAELPDDLAWTAGNPHVAGAYARLAAAIDAAGDAAMTARARGTISDRIADWRGEDLPPDRSWIDQTLAPLESHERPTARLALLTALASYRVDDGVVAECRNHGATDAALVGAAAWGAFEAARRVGEWIGG